MSLEDILLKVAEYTPEYVTVTGGEPLAQKDCLKLLSSLCDAGYQTSLETSGALDISAVDPRVSKVMDIKTPDSGEAEKNRYENIQYLKPRDQVKFVVGSRQDYDWSRKILDQYSLASHCGVLFSSVHETLEPKTLADWILEDRLPVRFQIQLHKYLWGEGPGR